MVKFEFVNCDLCCFLHKSLLYVGSAIRLLLT